MSNYFVYALGFLAQLLFASRLLMQWIKSEKAGRVLSPIIFWQLSLIASFLLMIYGVLRNDIVIIGGQIVSYFIYIRNLRFKRAWRFIPLWFRSLVIIFPIMSSIWLLVGDDYSLQYILDHSEISMPLLTWGTMAQIVFSLRFVYQWIYSERIQKSVLPVGFWVISMIGSLMIISYAVFRKDPVLLLGQLFGTVVYTRNLMIHWKNKQKESQPVS